mmetsp:Transcript_70306/g.228545  ORF Transcript_70306/g.228545 Transcript_70306/m.228545 type:complete len:516 (+) Transcript_70306:726-2273(+)
MLGCSLGAAALRPVLSIGAGGTTLDEASETNKPGGLEQAPPVLGTAAPPCRGTMARSGSGRCSSASMASNAAVNSSLSSTPSLSIKDARQSQISASSAAPLAKETKIDSPSVVVLNLPMTLRSSEANAVTMTGTKHCLGHRARAARCRQWRRRLSNVNHLSFPCIGEPETSSFTGDPSPLRSLGLKATTSMGGKGTSKSTWPSGAERGAARRSGASRQAATASSKAEPSMKVGLILACENLMASGFRTVTKATTCGVHGRNGPCRALGETPTGGAEARLMEVGLRSEDTLRVSMGCWCMTMGVLTTNTGDGSPGGRSSASPPVRSVRPGGFQPRRIEDGEASSSPPSSLSPPFSGVPRPVPPAQMSPKREPPAAVLGPVATVTNFGEAIGSQAPPGARRRDCVRAAPCRLPTETNFGDAEEEALHCRLPTVTNFGEAEGKAVPKRAAEAAEGVPMDTNLGDTSGKGLGSWCNDWLVKDTATGEGNLVEVGAGNTIEVAMAHTKESAMNCGVRGRS